VKLTDLDPRWFTLHGWASESPFRIGMTFLCPHCRTERLGVLFERPVDPDGIAEKFEINYDAVPFGRTLNMHVWNRTGDTFDVMTLTPSIDGSGVGHWHGFITNGEVR
jgi:hypothetical protein